jgi:hypothetical protein
MHRGVATVTMIGMLGMAWPECSVVMTGPVVV